MEITIADLKVAKEVYKFRHNQSLKQEKKVQSFV